MAATCLVLSGCCQCVKIEESPQQLSTPQKFEKYQQLRDYKAFAVGFTSSGSMAMGWSWDKLKQDSAIHLALKECRKNLQILLTKDSLGNECRVYAVGNTVIMNDVQLLD